MNLRWCLVLGALTFLPTLVNADSAPQTSNSWNILIYMAADNDLEYRAYEDIREMETVGSSDKVQIFVYLDDRSEKTRTLQIQKSNRPYRGQPKEFQSKILKEEGEVDSGSFRTLKNFITSTNEDSKSEHTMLFLWGHGTGLSYQEPVRLQGLGQDDSSLNFIRTNQLVEALDLSLSQRVDIIAFDACLLSLLEVADSLSGYADYFVASQERLPGDGFPYDKILRELETNPQVSSRNFSIRITELTGESYDEGSQGRRDVSVSAIDIAALERFKRHLSRWSRQIRLKGVITSEDLRRAGREALSSNDLEYRDLFSYLENILAQLKERKSENLDSVLRSTQKVLDEKQQLVMKAFSRGQFAGYSGLSIYLPTGYWGASWNSILQSRRYEYNQMKFAQTTDWDEHLDFVFPPEK